MKTGNKYLWLGLILVITMIAYLPVLQNNSFVWDDEGYITNNPLVLSFDLKGIFSANVMGNYHPVTVFVLALEHLVFGMNAEAYHIFHLLLHLVNILLVYLVINKLSRRTEVALVTALLFGIHPLHVESVAWLSGLKDLLFTGFFLGSWFCYLKYLENSQRKFYFLTLLLFLLSLLSKPVAVTLPVVLLLSDFYLSRRLVAGVWLEKLPFFMLSIVFGILAMATQKSSGNLPGLDFNVFQQLTLAAYGFVNYLIKLVLPFQLSAFYPYPFGHNDPFPVLWYVYPLLLVVLAVLVIYSLKKSKLVFFTAAFFFVNVALVLQWLPVGKAIMADRYSYLPSLAVFFLAAEGLYLLWHRKLKWLVIIITTLYPLYFILYTFHRSEVWKNEISLWNDVVSKFENVPLAYLNRGIAYARLNVYDLAISDLNKAIQLDSDNSKANKNMAKAYFNRGNLYLDKRQVGKALDDFTKSLEINPQNPKAFYNRGNVYAELGESANAVADYTRAIELNPEDARPYINRGMVYGGMKEYEKALMDFDKAELIQPNNPDTHFNRGLVYMNHGEYDKSIPAFSKAIELNPEDAEAWFNRGYLLITMKRYKEAAEDFSKLVGLNPADPRGFYYRGLALYYSSEEKSARNDLNHAAALGYQPAKDFLKVLPD